jgi:uncharacterized membrane protein YcfT
VGEVGEVVSRKSRKVVSRKLIIVVVRFIVGAGLAPALYALVESRWSRESEVMNQKSKVISFDTLL